MVGYAVDFVLLMLIGWIWSRVSENSILINLLIGMLGSDEIEASEEKSVEV